MLKSYHLAFLSFKAFFGNVAFRYTKPSVSALASEPRLYIEIHVKWYCRLSKLKTVFENAKSWFFLFSGVKKWTHLAAKLFVRSTSTVIMSYTACIAGKVENCSLTMNILRKELTIESSLISSF